MFLIICIVCITLFLSLSFAVSILETSISSVNIASLNVIYKNNPSSKNKRKIIKHILDNYSALLTIIIISNGLAGIISSALVTMLCNKYHANAIISAAAIGFISFLFIVVGEIFPKNLGRVFPEKVIIFLTSFIVVMLFIFKPITFFFDLIFKKFQYKKFVTKQHLIEWIKISEIDGQISNSERTMIESAILFQQKKINEIMVPKSKAVFLYEKNSYRQNMEIVLKHRFSRYIFMDLENKPSGKIFSKDILKKYVNLTSNHDAESETINIDYANLIKKVLVFNVNTSLAKAMDLFRKEREHIAIINSPTKEFLGLLFLEDLIEEIVGEIYNEDETYSIIEFGNKLFHVSATANIIEIFKTYFKKTPCPKTDAITFYDWLVTNNQNRPLKNNQFFVYSNLRIIYKLENKMAQAYIEIHYIGNDALYDTTIQSTIA